MFPTNQIIVSPCVHIFDIISLFAAELEDPKIGKWGKGFIQVVFNAGLTVFDVLPFCKWQILKLKEFADNNSIFGENGRKVFKWVETMWEKEKLLVASNADM